MPLDLLSLAAAFVVILAGAELFTNGIEWFGHKLDLAEGAVGSVLAAVGTALPETMIPLIAIVFGGGATATEIGIGAILGAPFMLATLAMFVTGVAVVALRKRRATGGKLVVDSVTLARDVSYFAVCYAVAIAAAFLPAGWGLARALVAVALLGAYALYVVRHLREERASESEGLAPLRFHRLDRGAPQHPEPPRLRVVSLQVVVALAAIVGGAWIFVGAVDRIAASLSVNGTLLALVIAPIATELPEKLNSVIWVRQGKDTLAMGNITGAMVFQSAIPTSVGLLLAPSSWAVSGASGIAFASAGIAFASAALIFVPAWRTGRLSGWGLLGGGAFYLAYLGIVGVSLSSGAL